MNKDQLDLSFILFGRLLSKQKELFVQVLFYFSWKLCINNWCFRHNDNEKLHKGVLAASVIGSIILLLLIGRF